MNEKTIELNEIKCDLASFYELNETQRIKFLKNEEVEKKKKFMHTKEYYRNKVFFSYEPNVIDSLDLDIEFCETPEQRDLWNYLKIMTTSAHTYEKTMKEFKMLLKDKNTNQYLGILNLSPDVYSYEARDKFIGWTNQNKAEKIHVNGGKMQPRISFLINIQCCVGLQPIAHNLNIGKLLVALVFSREVLEKYKEKYGYYYAGVCTLSLYGKGIQYDRLKEIKYIGETKGYGVSHIPFSIMEKIIEFVKKYNPDKYEYYTHRFLNKMRLMRYFVSEYDCLKEYVFHQNKRGIYFGYTGTNNHLFFQGIQNTFQIDKTKNIQDIVIWWKDRWARPRWKHLQETHRVKIAFEFKDLTHEEKKIEYNRQYQFERYHGDEDFRTQLLQKKKEKYHQHKMEQDESQHAILASVQRRTISFQEILEIIQWKEKYIQNEKFMDGKKISKQKVADYLSTKFDNKITEGMIKKYWNGSCVLYSFEFGDDSTFTYERYREIINYQKE